MDNTKTVVVLGGTGFVGRALCRQLGARGNWKVRVVTRERARSTPVASIPNVVVEQADIREEHVLGPLLLGADAVVNLVAILHGSEAQFRRIHVDLPRRVADASQRGGCRQLVHVSALGVDTPGSSLYLQSKAEGERAVLAGFPQATLLRSSVIFGAEDRFINTFARLQRFAPILPLGCSEALFQPVWVEDVARAIAACMASADSAGRVYECAGPDVLTLSDIVRRAGRSSGAQRPILPLPLPLAYFQACLMELMPGEPLMSRDNVRSMQVPNIAHPGALSLKDLGVVPQSLDGYLAAR